MRRPVLAAAVLAGVAFAGCGGGDDPAQIEHTLREFIKATNERDADKACGDVVSQEFVERFTGATGKGARDACRRQVKTERAPSLKLIEVRKPRIHGDEATVSTTLEQAGLARPQVFRLKHEGGDWRLAGTTGG